MFLVLLGIACGPSLNVPASPTWPPKEEMVPKLQAIELVFITEEAMKTAPPGPVYVNIDGSPNEASVRMMGKFPFRGLRHPEDWTPADVEMFHAELKKHGHQLDCEMDP